ncbi:hypothetical protein GIB67_012566 [Kingdonia uniflora]|uniref:Uncharacterized protein n=1 Tax=Kingdonia uniflora TaxID=39325 RepID=A0A7J7NEJ7_9MAGN|nr:hypothetical protein GIB67_012566 [Kingdonia uniflora]
MEVFGRVRKVWDPLGDDVKACICNWSSGSEHEGEDESPCLYNLVHGFLEDSIEDEGQEISLGELLTCKPNISYAEITTEMIKDLVKPPDNNNGDSFVLVLHSNVLKAVEIFSFFRTNKPVFLRKVMMYLRDLGVNAGICKTKWETKGGITAGSFEFIDVVQADVRYLVDIDFAGEFEVARPTAQYERLMQMLPRIYIGTSEELKKVLKLMCDAAKMSLKERGLHVPPWRKNRYMQVRWLGQYHRTINQSPSKMIPPPGIEKFIVTCRSLGFNTGNLNKCPLVVPSRTRIK